jgi:hypothetical protein
MFDLFSQLPKCDSDLINHKVKMAEMLKHPEHQILFEHLYSSLSILDAKSSSLLGFNSIIIAVFALFLARSDSLGLFGGISIGVGMSAVIISCFLLPSVVWVHWSTTDDFGDPDRHAVDLLRVRRSRTITYRLAWYFVVTSVISLSAFLVGKLLRL